MTRFHHAFLCLLGAALLNGCGASPQEQYARAQTAFAAQDFNAARIDLVSALRATPGDREMLLLLARSQLRLGDSAGALATAETLRALGTQSAELARIEAEADLLAGKPREAVARLENDASADSWRIRAAAMLHLGDPSGALNAYEEGMARGDELRLISDYAHFLLAANDVAGASALAERLRDTASNAFPTLMLAGDIAIRTGNTEVALAHYRQAADLYPKQLRPLMAEAGALEAMGKLKTAQQVAKRAATLAPDDPWVKALRLRLAAVAGEWDWVRSELLPAESSLNPQSSEAMLYGEALLRLGYAEQARAQLSRTVLLQPGNRYARRMLGEAQLLAGDANGAFQTLLPLGQGLLVQRDELASLERAARQASEPGADDWRARLESPRFQRLNELVSQGEAAMMSNDWSGAATAWKRVLAIGEDSTVLGYLAFALVMSGDPAAAIAPADRALALTPEATDIRITAAMARIRARRDLDAARALLRRVQQEQPMNLQAALLLRQAQAAAG